MVHSVGVRACHGFWDAGRLLCGYSDKLLREMYPTDVRAILATRYLKNELFLWNAPSWLFRESLQYAHVCGANVLRGTRRSRSQFSRTGKPARAGRAISYAWNYHLILPSPTSGSTDMLGIENSDAPTSKCYFTHAVLGEHVDERQPPTKKKPFSTILAQPFSHTVRRPHPLPPRDLEGHAADSTTGRPHTSRGDLRADKARARWRSGDVSLRQSHHVSWRDHRRRFLQPLHQDW